MGVASEKIAVGVSSEKIVVVLHMEVACEMMMTLLFVKLSCWTSLESLKEFCQNHQGQMPSLQHLQHR